jgi:hypothetical protein
MSLQKKLTHELRVVAVTTLYFAVWLGVLMVIKKLILEEYKIPFAGFSMVLVGSLILAKVVLVLEHVPMGAWIQNRPAVFEVLWRTALYALGVFLALILEKAFEARHEQGGFIPALTHIFQHPEIPHVLANSICAACALLAFNALSIIRRHLGEGNLMRLYFSSGPSNAMSSKAVEPVAREK